LEKFRVAASLTLNVKTSKATVSNPCGQPTGVNVGKLIAELLEISDGHASISSCSAGFRPRPEPPDTVEQWVVHR